MLSISEATEKDIPLIEDIAQKVWYRTYRFVISQDQMDYMYSRMYTPAALAQQMKDGHKFLIAWMDNEPLGFASYYTENNIIKVPKLYIRFDKQGKGIGQALLNSICEKGRATGCTQLQLNVNRFNPAVGFYLKYGMHIQQIVDIPYHTFVLNDYVMAIDL